MMETFEVYYLFGMKMKSFDKEMPITIMKCPEIFMHHVQLNTRRQNKQTVELNTDNIATNMSNLCSKEANDPDSTNANAS